jgi:hypothetical protein
MCTCLNGLDDESIAFLSGAVGKMFLVYLYYIGDTMRTTSYYDVILLSFLFLCCQRKYMKHSERAIKRCIGSPKLHDKNLNSQMYCATKADTAALFYRLDIGPQYPQRPVCTNAFHNVLAIFRRPWEKLKNSVRIHSGGTVLRKMYPRDLITVQ